MTKNLLPLALCAAFSCTVQAYPDHGLMPSAMVDNSLFPYPSFFQTKDFNADGTLKSNPVIDAGSQRVKDVNYHLKKLSSGDSIRFPDKDGKSYVVYSAIPENMTTEYAYQHTSEYYDPSLLNSGQYDFPKTAPSNLNGGNVSELTLEKSVVPGSNDNDKVFIAKSDFYLPNLPNKQNNHKGSLEHVYWTVDPWLNSNTKKSHLLPYGWAYDATSADFSLIWNNLTSAGNMSGIVNLQQTGAFNYWKHVLTLGDNAALSDALFSAIQSNGSYPFPKPRSKDDLWQTHGAYLPVQPMPGFQQNLIRWYTPWGAWNLMNNTSGLFVRKDGSVEIPAYQDGGDWQPYPVVTQTWDETQRFTVLNLTNEVIPSTYDQYPGSEYYFAANTYLPNTAGVITTYKDYAVYDDTNTLNPRQTDIWLGMKGDSAADVMQWDDNSGKEPGGQANKPYMMGADISHRSNHLYHTLRLQNSNSFMLASLPKTHKLYAATFCIDSGKGYEAVGTLSYQWQPWTIVGNAQQKPMWVSSNEGSWIPVIKSARDDLKHFINTAEGQHYYADSAGARSVSWAGSPYNEKQVNQLDGPVYFYTIAASTDKPDLKFVIVLSDGDDDPSKNPCK